MVSEGDDAPEFTAPLANGDTETVTLSDRLDDAPIVLAFFPGAFTSVCSHEMSTFEDRLDALTEHGATLFGVSIDTPFSLNEFRDELGLSFGLISDTNRDLVTAYDVATDFADIGVEDIAERAVFVVDSDGTITYSWVGENAGVEPDYDEVEAAVEQTATN
ncbi:Peroxiredoxin [Halovenus aranensis]|jgi:peroxiredoxin|uniref:Peroxiredoxin n=1 Tax=Halovenus aranensis TaxID=890420 RepID=A0A1G8T5A3_9EURY|nr:redoxin domain-containing protein [Halovenus aranensis]SDJ36155.1 Peroxiredoxin [Halovenus aranensis]